MPSPRGVVAVVLFWLVTTVVVVKRDVWPRLVAGGPPPIAIDLADEASQTVPIHWALTRDGQKVGSLTTRMKHLDADDTFRFTYTYRQVRVDVGGLRVTIPSLVETTRVSRAGDLREHHLDGRLSVAAAGAELEGTATLDARVVDGKLVGSVEADSPGLGRFATPLDPVAVPAGRVLNPLQPVNRLAHVRPGLRWTVPEVNPLRDAVTALVRQRAPALASALGGRQAEELIAEVAADPVDLTLNGKPTPCWVIEYRDRAVRARTWVRVGDGKVLRQEAFDGGERIALEREE